MLPSWALQKDSAPSHSHSTISKFPCGQETHLTSRIVTFSSSLSAFLTYLYIDKNEAIPSIRWQPFEITFWLQSGSLMAYAMLLPPSLGEVNKPSRIVERWTPLPSGANPDHYTPKNVPIIDTTMQTLLSLVNVSIIAVLLTRRVVAVRQWTKLQPLNWLVMFIYTDCLIFVILSAVTSLGVGANVSVSFCLFADFLCIASYLSTKLGIYYFLVEKIYLIRSVRQPRLKDKLYLFHAFGLVMFFMILTILQFVFRIGYISKDGQCFNGIQADVLTPLLIFDTACNVYLMIMFIIPLRKLMSYAAPNSMARQIALRTITGTSITLASSILNLTQLIIVQGERSWLCLITCNLDILLSVMVIQLITANDGTDSDSSGDSRPAKATDDSSRNLRSKMRPEKPVMMPPEKKRKSTDFSDLDSMEDLEALGGEIRMEGPLSSPKDPGSSGRHDGSFDRRPSSTGHDIGKSDGHDLNVDRRQLRTNHGFPSPDGHDGSFDRRPSLRTRSISGEIMMKKRLRKSSLEEPPSPEPTGLAKLTVRFVVQKDHIA